MSFSTHIFDSEDPEFPNLPNVILEEVDNNEAPPLVFDPDIDTEDKLEEDEESQSEESKLRFRAFGRGKSRSSSVATVEGPQLSPVASTGSSPRARPHNTQPHGRECFEMDLEAQDSWNDNKVCGIMLDGLNAPTSTGLQIEEPEGMPQSTAAYYRSRRSSAATSVRRKSVAPSRGNEPGLNPLFSETLQRSIGSSVTIVDYSLDRYKVVHGEVHRNQSTEKFKQLIDEKPSWSKVRWINVNGLSFEAISCIAEKYNLHRLALEDMVDIPQRTKIDPYHDQLFCVLPLHKLVVYEDQSGRSKRGFLRRILDPNSIVEMKDNLLLSRTTTITSVSSDTKKRSKRGGLMSKEMSTYEFEADSLSAEIANVPMETMYEWHTPVASAKRTAFLHSKRPLSAQKRIVGMEQVSIFLVKGSKEDEGTVISFFEHSAADVERRILTRIASPTTILRESCDASLLLQAILDGIVDLIMPIIITYQNKMADYESQVLQQPSVGLSQNLHLLDRDLCMLRSTIAPITSVINSLRASHTHASQNGSATPTTGMISELAKTYLADVADHSQIFTEDLDIMRAGTKNMTDLIFNTITSKSNDFLAIISFITVILQPMSVISGVFGMNFTDFPEIREYSVSYYWYTTVPVVGGLLILLIFKTYLLALIEWCKIKLLYSFWGHYGRYY